MMNDDIEKLRGYNNRIATMLNELEVLEDGVDCDYSYTIICLQQATRYLERRRENLQQRGRCL